MAICAIWYRISTELNKKDEVQQIYTMTYCMGDEADDIFKTFTFAEGQEKKYVKVKEKFDQHFTITGTQRASGRVLYRFALSIGVLRI